MKPHRWYRLRSSIPAFAIVAASLCLAGCPSVPETNSPPQDSETAAQPAATTVRRASTRMFSQEYVSALSNILDLEADGVAALEQRLSEDPNDWATRLRIMAYDARGDRAHLEESRDRRVRYTLWLIEHQPDSEILAGPSASIGHGELSADEYRRAGEIWERALAEHPDNARVWWNASRLYREANPERYATYLRQAVALDSANEHYGRELGWLYAGAIINQLRGGPAEREIHVEPDTARRELDTTSNSALLEAAVHLLQSEYNRSHMVGQPDSRFGELAKQYFRRAEVLNPGLDRLWVFPRMDPQMGGILGPDARPSMLDQRRFDEAAAAIRRLPIDSFPQLPEGVAGVLREKGCIVPQPEPEGPGVNVISGEFFATGQAGWAVLCSRNGQSVILVFRDESGASPEELAPADDRGFLQGVGNGVIAYSRQISTVDRQYIVRHYRAYGGPEPPPIRHAGIDDAFLEKASVVHYWYEDTWLRLTGAD